MNKIITILICLFGLHTISAQTSLDISFLKNNNWMLIEEEGKDTLIVSFDNERMYTSEHIHFFHPISGKHFENTLKIDFTYYLSDTITDSYDATKVGKVPSGRYLTVHNLTAKHTNPNDYTTFEVTKKSSSEIVLTLYSFSANYLNKKGRIFLLKRK